MDVRGVQYSPDSGVRGGTRNMAAVSSSTAALQGSSSCGYNQINDRLLSIQSSPHGIIIRDLRDLSKTLHYEVSVIVSCLPNPIQLLTSLFVRVSRSIRQSPYYFIQCSIPLRVDARKPCKSQDPCFGDLFLGNEESIIGNLR